VTESETNGNDFHVNKGKKIFLQFGHWNGFWRNAVYHIFKTKNSELIK
jgi:hypothetical protein